MGYTNKTSHYDLPQWIAGDKPSWLGDVNTAMLNIDTAIAGADASATAAESSAAAANAQVQAQEAKITKNTTDIQTLTGELADVSGVASAALPKNGGTMTGALTLAGAPTQDLQAATKKYVDEHGSGIATDLTIVGSNIQFKNRISKYRFNNAILSCVFNGDTINSAPAGNINVGAGIFIPLIKTAANPLNLPVKNPPAIDSDLTNLSGVYTITKNSTSVEWNLTAYYDGSNTYIGVAGDASTLTSVVGAKINGYITEVL